MWPMSSMGRIHGATTGRMDSAVDLPVETQFFLWVAELPLPKNENEIPNQVNHSNLRIVKVERAWMPWVMQLWCTYEDRSPWKCGVSCISWSTTGKRRFCPLFSHSLLCNQSAIQYWWLLILGLLTPWQRGQPLLAKGIKKRTKEVLACSLEQLVSRTSQN